MKRFLSKTALVIGASLLALLLGELALRIYNPAQTRIVGDQIKLQKNFSRVVELDPRVIKKGLDTSINYSTNAWGFRGNAIPDDSDSFVNIVAIGGSTTECSLLDDAKTWPQQLEILLQQNNENIIVQNAGIDGASSYGHQILLDEHILALKPQVALFLVGINDLFQGIYPSGDAFLSTNRKYRIRSMAKRSELFNLALNVYRQVKVKRLGVGHLDHPEAVALTPREYLARIDLHKSNQSAYGSRLKMLIQTSRENDITPVLITQPFLSSCQKHYCAGIDLYNQTTREAGSELELLVIDLAAELKDTAFFYDEIHYNVEGARMVAKVVAEELIRHQSSAFSH